VVKLFSKIQLIIALILVFSMLQNSYAAENDYGNVMAWYNDIPATAENIQLKIGEPSIIKVEVESKIDGSVFVMLDETGVTKAYNVIDGPSQIGNWIDNTHIDKGWKNTFIWTIIPNGDWKEGNAPINIFVQFSKKANDDEIIRFSIANPYILDEQYSGPTPKPTPDPKSTDQPPSSEGLPGFSVVAALMWVGFVAITRRRMQ